jgi:hypothetical protein
LLEAGGGFGVAALPSGHNAEVVHGGRFCDLVACLAGHLAGTGVNLDGRGAMAAAVEVSEQHLGQADSMARLAMFAGKCGGSRQDGPFSIQPGSGSGGMGARLNREGAWLAQAARLV